MAYVLNQFNQPMVAAADTSSVSNQVYMTQLSDGTARRRTNSSDIGVSGGSLNPFYDECVQIDSLLSKGINYYFHAKIKRLNSDQTFYIYLVNYDDTSASTEDVKTQYLKTITVQGGNENEWVDFEILFSPLVNFDCILFQLQRTVEDYRENTRYPVIIYEELSRVNNAISSKIKSGVELVKIGIQSHPGLMMCLNGEEIHIGRSGVYEVRNGVINVTFFSVVFGAEEVISTLRNPQTGTSVESLEEYLDAVAAMSVEPSSAATNSQCIFNNSKTRAIDPFTFDYMYSEEE